MAKCTLCGNEAVGELCTECLRDDKDSQEAQEAFDSEFGRRTATDHDCMDHASYYEFEEDGQFYHGWECAVCGELLQTG